MTKHQAADEVLRVFQRLNVQTNVLSTREIGANLDKHGPRDLDANAGIRQAIENGWLIETAAIGRGEKNYRLTDKGAARVQSLP